MGLFKFLFPLVLAFLAHTLWKAGDLKTLVPHGPECKKIMHADLEGCEDIDMIGQTALLSNGQNAILMNNSRPLTEIIADTEIQGNIHAYSLITHKLVRLDRIDFPHLDFHPHGISVLTRPKAKPLLYVVNHRRDGDAVEEFEVHLETHSIKYIRSYTHPLLYLLNDVTALEPGKFYVSTWMHYHHANPLSKIEQFLQMPWCHVSFCELGADNTTTSCQVAADGLSMANGVLLSPDKSKMYIVNTLGQDVNEYERLSNNSLRLLRRIPTIIHGPMDPGTLCDNLYIDHATGDMYTGCHPKALTFVMYAHKHIDDSPSQVLRLKAGASKFEEIYLSNGGAQSLDASSVATVYGRNLLIGAVRDPGFLHCTLPDEQ